MRAALIFYARDFLGGAERRLLRIYSQLAKESITCDIIVFGCKYEKLMEILTKADCKVDLFNRIYVFENKRRCISCIIRSSYNVVHFVDTSSLNILVSIICKLKKTYCLYSICNYYIAKGLTTPNAIRKTKILLRIVDHVDLLYPSSYGYISKLTKREVTITPGTFTDLVLFQPAEKKRLILFVAARLESAKNPMLVLSSVVLIQDYLRKQKYHISVLGKGYEEDKLRSYIAEQGVSDIVDIVGYIRTSEILPSARVFLSLQKIENYPSQSLAEAISCGCYAIITDVGDSRKCAEPDFAEYIPEEPEELAKAIKSYINKSDEEKRRIIKSAREYALTNYSIEKSKEYFHKLIMNVIPEGGRKNEMR